MNRYQQWSGMVILAIVLFVLSGCAGGPRPIEVVFVKGGCFQMGDITGIGEPDERPVHEVCVKDFYMGKYEVTQRQWEEIMGENFSAYKGCGPECPVDGVSWNIIQEFLKKLNSSTGKQYRLPTEAEWEYAARSGGKEENWAGTNDKSRLAEFAWYGGDDEATRHPVGLKKPNGLGLHDMSGSIVEWCQDWYSADYYKNSPKDNPSGPESGEKRALRGGSLRTTKRESDPPDTGDGNYGFRLLRQAR